MKKFNLKSHLDEIVKDFIAFEKKKAKNLKKFYKQDFDNRLKWLKEYLKPGDVIDDETLLYFPEKHPGISIRDLNNIFACLDVYAPIHWIQDKKCKFAKENCEYKELIFTRMFGQGTALFITKI